MLLNIDYHQLPAASCVAVHSPMRCLLCLLAIIKKINIASLQEQGFISKNCNLEEKKQLKSSFSKCHIVLAKEQDTLISKSQSMHIEQLHARVLFFSNLIVNYIITETLLKILCIWKRAVALYAYISKKNDSYKKYYISINYFPNLSSAAYASILDTYSYFFCTEPLCAISAYPMAITPRWIYTFSLAACKELALCTDTSN